MCGIIGYTGNSPCADTLLTGLAALEYRGYDSAGIAVMEETGVRVVKTGGRLSDLRKKLALMPDICGCTGIGHTRWATHGMPDELNAHPHTADTVTLVHNGIIENYLTLREELVRQGVSFLSETDTEVALCCLAQCYRACGDPIRALFAVGEKLRGSFAFGVLFHDRPGKIYAMRRDSPLIVAKGRDGGYIASDIPAILPYTREYYRLPENTVCELCADGIRFTGADGERLALPLERVEWDVRAAEKGGYPFFMRKEIAEEADAVRCTLSRYLRHGLPCFGISALDEGLGSGNLHIVGCGTAMHAGLYGARRIEALARRHATVEIASEFRARDVVLEAGDTVLLISQSGETADTLAALRLASSRGIRTAAIVNVVGSSVAREADAVLYTAAGPEIAVASTKAYMVQCAMMELLAVRMALQRGCMTEEMARRYCAALLEEIPRALRETEALDTRIRPIALRLAASEHAFYIGRGIDAILAEEASLKLKEISYIHSEAYPAGELKHGTISLLVSGTPVIALITEEKTAEKMISAIREVKSRGAYVIGFASASLADSAAPHVDALVVIPAAGVSAPLSMMCALQLLAYESAAARGLDVDCPRNLAKSVTVE